METDAWESSTLIFVCDVRHKIEVFKNVLSETSMELTRHEGAMNVGKLRTGGLVAIL